MSYSGAEHRVWRRSRWCANGDCLEVGHGNDGHVLVRSSRRPEAVMRLTTAEWRSFLSAVTKGDFD